MPLFRDATSLAARLLLALAAATLCAPTARAQAQCPTLPGNAFAFLRLDATAASRCPSTPKVRWIEPRVVFECGFFADGLHGIDCGPGSPGSCVELCRGAAAVWNQDLPGRFTFVPADASTPVTFCTAGADQDFDGRTSIGGSDKLCDGSAFGGNVLAVTMRVTFTAGSQAGQLVDSDITVNQKVRGFTFDADSFRATITHELGHVLGLDHPDECGRNFNVLMRSASLFPSTSPCFVVVPTADDITGAQMIYAQSSRVCGDANGDGQVTDTDGVQVLRAAVSLSSVCTLATCDVDGNGVISDTDGVNVLRAAVGLPASSNCPL